MQSGSTAGNVRDRILHAATRLFAAHGFDGTPIQAIADAVGVTKPAVIHHFPSKEALHDSVLDLILARWNDVLPRLLLAATAGDARFDDLMLETVTFFRADPDRARLLMREVLDRPREMRELLRGHVKPWVLAIAEYIRKGQKTGEIPPDVDAEAYVVHAILLVVGGVACFECMGVLVPGDPKAGREREQEAQFAAEMLRIARTSLFTHGEPPPRGARPAVREAAKTRETKTREPLAEKPSPRGPKEARRPPRKGTKR